MHLFFFFNRILFAELIEVDIIFTYIQTLVSRNKRKQKSFVVQHRYNTHTRATMMKLFLSLTWLFVSVSSEQIIAIASGSGFNSSCTGYCYNSVYINATKITTLQTSKTNPVDYPTIRQDYSIDASEFNQLVQLIGNIQAWKTVDTPIGCPDCPQGIEWLDVYTDEQPKYGVTFEYNTTIQNYESVVDRLRTIRRQYFPVG